MNKGHIFVITLLVMLFGLQTQAHAEGYKLGAVNALRVLEQSPQADVARKMIEKEFESRDRELVASQKKLKGLEDRLAKDAAIMGESERKKLERDIITERRELKRSQDEFREDLNFRRNEEFAKIQKTIVETIQKVAVDNNYDVVLSEGVIYASSKVDMSQLVIDHLKKGSAEGKSKE